MRYWLLPIWIACAAAAKCTLQPCDFCPGCQTCAMCKGLSNRCFGTAAPCTPLAQLFDNSTRQADGWLFDAMQNVSFQSGAITFGTPIRIQGSAGITFGSYSIQMSWENYFTGHAWLEIAGSSNVRFNSIALSSQVAVTVNFHLAVTGCQNVTFDIGSMASLKVAADSMTLRFDNNTNLALGSNSFNILSVSPGPFGSQNQINIQMTDNRGLKLDPGAFGAATLSATTVSIDFSRSVAVEMGFSVFQGSTIQGTDFFFRAEDISGLTINSLSFALWSVFTSNDCVISFNRSDKVQFGSVIFQGAKIRSIGRILWSCAGCSEVSTLSNSFDFTSFQSINGAVVIDFSQSRSVTLINAFQATMVVGMSSAVMNFSGCIKT